MSFVPPSRGLTGMPALLALSLVAPASAQERAEKAAASAPAESAAQSAGAARVSRGPFRVIVEQDGVLVPSQATALGFWPLALEGELRIEEVAAHGARVEENDVILRLRDEKARDAIREARWALRAGESSLAAARARAADEEADAERDLARAEKDLELARSSFQGYVEVDRALDKEEYEASERSYRNNIEDQEDEIAQLGKMYAEDELTEETEEIVLKRAKRGLAETKKRLELLGRRHRYGEEFAEPARREAIENAVKDRERALRDLRRSLATRRELARIELEKLEHAAASTAKKVKELEADLEALTVRAPHGGILVHGSFEEKVAVVPLRKGATAAPNQTLLTVARPEALKARFSVKERDRYSLHAGMAAEIAPEALPGKRIAASLEPIGALPQPDGAWNAHAVFGHDDGKLLPLLKCKVRIVAADHASALTVPSKAVFRKDGRTVCFVKGSSPFGVAARPVIPGADDGTSTVILEGLSEGEEVLLEEPRP
jgi:HlyD family secretion protein